MTGAEERPCPSCGALFTWTPSSPRQRFCSTPCRMRWWDRHRRKRDRRRKPAGHDPRGHEPRRQDNDPRGQRELPDPVAVPACPHCRQPVAVVAWLVPPAAATVDTPTRHADHNA